MEIYEDLGAIIVEFDIDGIWCQQQIEDPDDPEWEAGDDSPEWLCVQVGDKSAYLVFGREPEDSTDMLPNCGCSGCALRLSTFG